MIHQIGIHYQLRFHGSCRKPWVQSSPDVTTKVLQDYVKQQVDRESFSASPNFHKQMYCILS